MATSATKNAVRTAEDLMDNRSVYDPSSPNFRLENSPFYLMAHADFKYHEDMDIVLHKHGVSKPIYRVMTVLRDARFGAPSKTPVILMTAYPSRENLQRARDIGINEVLVTPFTTEQLGAALGRVLTPDVPAAGAADQLFL